ncbi:MAG: diguanylate cyclase [Arhodomonas sp.]|nr:diguanylate cyclase [Arhodomonas sp.]
MGVASAFSVALHGDEGLWGLLAGHGSHPRVLPPPVREAVVALTRAAAQRLFLLREREADRFRRAVHDSRDSLVGAGEHIGGPGESAPTLRGALAGAVRCRWHRPSCRRAAPRTGACAGALAAPCHDRFARASDGSGGAGMGQSRARCRSARGPGEGYRSLPGAGGAPALEQGDAGWLIFFRGEEVETRRWAGDPHKPAVGEVGESGLGPRHSFATWVERLRGRSRPWTEAQRRAAPALISARIWPWRRHCRCRELNRRLARQRAALETANEQLEHLAHTDPLTQVRNRYGTELAIDAEISAAERYGRPLSLLLFDVDHFKQFNEPRGHRGPGPVTGYPTLPGRGWRRLSYAAAMPSDAGAGRSSL